jgi:hypothetical protein
VLTGKDEIPGNARGFLLVPVMFTSIFFLVVILIFSGVYTFFVKLSPIVMFGMVMVVTWIDWATMNQKLDKLTGKVVKTVSLIAFLIITTLILFNILPP